MKNLLQRILTALILLPAVIFSFFRGGNALIFLLSLVALICAFEITNIILPKLNFARVLTAIIFCGIFLPLVFFKNITHVLVFMSLAIFVFNTVILFSRIMDRKLYERLAAIFFLSFYVFVGLACVFWLQSGVAALTRNMGVAFILMGCVATWCNDSFAYFGGNLFGKTPLFKRVSHKKTWEGFISGAFFIVVLAFLTNYLTTTFYSDLFFGVNFADILWIMLPVIILAPIGDLIESRVKRLYSVKDTSNILPGHGGVLDRIDSLLVVLPWTALYAFIIRPLY